MGRSKVLGLFTIAALIAAAGGPGAAFATGAGLLGASGEASAKDNGTATFESTGGGIAVKCTSSEGTVTWSNDLFASYDELYLGCTAGGAKCTGLSDTTAGSILEVGTIEVQVVTRNGVPVGLELVYSPVPIHFECLGVLTEVRGSRIGLLTNKDAEKTTKLTDDEVGSKGKDEITEVNGVNHHLEAETNGSAFGEADLNQSVTVSGGEVEVMF